MVLIGDTYLICYNGLVVGIWFCEWKLFWFGILYIFKRVIEKKHSLTYSVLFALYVRIGHLLLWYLDVYSEEFMSCSWFYKECLQFKSYDVFQTEPVLSFDEY